MDENTPILKKLYNAFDPARAASDKEYVDLSRVRGGEVFIRRCRKEFGLAEKPLRFLFSGHIGCGKSSELTKLCEELESEDGIGAFLINTLEYLDHNDTTMSDLLLCILLEVGDQVESRYQIKIDPSTLGATFEALTGLVSNYSLEKASFNLGLFKVEFQRAARSQEGRRQIRERVQPLSIALLQEVNDLLDFVRKKLKEDRHLSNFVVVLDNLEKIRQGPGPTLSGSLFLHNASQLVSLGVHCILTVPLSLVRSHGPQLATLYGREPFVLPMVKVLSRDDQPHKQGYDALKEVVRKRLPDHNHQTMSVDEVFQGETLDFLVRYSGGDLRLLIRLVREVVSRAEAFPFKVELAQDALKQSIQTFSTSIPEGHWQKLIELSRSPSRTISNGDPDYGAMLEQTSVLEYINGEGDKDLFLSAAPWYAVHPIVRELPRFRDGLKSLT